MTFIWQAGILKRVWIGNSDSKIFNGNIVATSFANMIKINPVTPEIARVTTAPFRTKRQKSAYSTEYLGNYWTNLHQTFSVSSHMYGDYKTMLCMYAARGNKTYSKKYDSNLLRQFYIMIAWTSYECAWSLMPRLTLSKLIAVSKYRGSSV